MAAANGFAAAEIFILFIFVVVFVVVGGDGAEAFGCCEEVEGDRRCSEPLRNHRRRRGE